MLLVWQPCGRGQEPLTHQRLTVQQARQFCADHMGMLLKTGTSYTFLKITGQRFSKALSKCQMGMRADELRPQLGQLLATSFFKDAPAYTLTGCQKDELVFSCHVRFIADAHIQFLLLPASAH